MEHIYLLKFLNNVKSLEINFSSLKTALIIDSISYFEPSTFTKSLILLFQYIYPAIKFIFSFYFLSSVKFYRSFSNLLC